MSKRSSFPPPYAQSASARAGLLVAPGSGFMGAVRAGLLVFLEDFL